MFQLLVKVQVKIQLFLGTPSQSYGKSLAIWGHTCHLTHQRLIGRLSIWLWVTDGHRQVFRWSTHFLSRGTFWEETLALLDQFQNYQEIPDNRTNFALLRASKK